MTTIKRVESQIRRIEGFDVRIRYVGPGPTPGRDVRSDRADIRSYPYERARADDHNVAVWLEDRFCATYGGYTADVLDASGRRQHGATKLRTVRATYNT
jgi:hypothetical protein